jgi:hypothetical protein
MPLPRPETQPLSPHDARSTAHPEPKLRSRLAMWERGARAGSGSSRSGVVVAAAALRASHPGECLLTTPFFGLSSLRTKSDRRITSISSIPNTAPSKPSRCSWHNRPRRAAGRAHRVQALVENCERTNPMHTAIDMLVWKNFAWKQLLARANCARVSLSETPAGSLDYRP